MREIFMREREDLMSWIRGELVGPSPSATAATIISFSDCVFVDPEAIRRGALAWRPFAGERPEEVLYYDRETPHRKYGAGQLHPPAAPLPVVEPVVEQAASETDTLGVEPQEDEIEDAASGEGNGEGSGDGQLGAGEGTEAPEAADDFEVTSPEVRHPSVIGVSFRARLNSQGTIIIRLPQGKRLAWQCEGSIALALNGRYEACTRRWTDDKGVVKDAPMWRRWPAVLPDTAVLIKRDELVSGKPLRRKVAMPDASPITLRVEIFPRQAKDHDDDWLLTVVLRNTSDASTRSREAVLYQTFFEVSIDDGDLEKYPESERPFHQLDGDEQSLGLLYRESATWAIGHGCAASWDAEPGEAPRSVYADVMPAVQLPSMTPDIRDSSGDAIQLSMRDLAALPDDRSGPAWKALAKLLAEYGAWIKRQTDESKTLPAHLRTVAERHIEACEACHRRIRTGLSLLRDDPRIRDAFRLANLSMLLQQIATKRLERRPLGWNAQARRVDPQGDHRSPSKVYDAKEEDAGKGVGIGYWRAFQIAFVLMSLEGLVDGRADDHDTVDLIWFPTGGGKTEAYLAVMAFYMFHQRLCIKGDDAVRRDGTNVLMRYTLRMLTTQQFQRAASLICSMEYLRRHPDHHRTPSIPGERFALGLWIGGDGSPNNIKEANAAVSRFRRGDDNGSPLVLTECPWCRAEIGRYDGPKPSQKPKLTDSEWNSRRTRGLTAAGDEGPLLHCPDSTCEFGGEARSTWLPVEVIDERIYNRPPSLIIATADKLAMVAYRPRAGALFGRRFVGGEPCQEFFPPGLIIQDELHLISGPLGTMYALYEAIFERLCSWSDAGRLIKPKLIASTATIRGAQQQVLALYARKDTQLFPSPGLFMSDSFFGTYARDNDQTLLPGRMYLGIHANDYGSILTTQVRAFSTGLFCPYSFRPERRDPWWSLLVFYNSLRELGGAKTLFDSDIRSRLKFMFNREGYGPRDRRNLRIVEELTSRLSQAEIVQMLDRLSTVYSEPDNNALDACLASNIIEVGVDIDRLSLMGVVGQPKATAQYIQVTGRVGRRWWERPGLILTIYNPSKSRDRSHFEQFHSYHRRLYERVEPTSATPFAISAIQRALAGALILWARQQSDADVQSYASYRKAVDFAFELLRERCEVVQDPGDMDRSLKELERVRDELERKWRVNPQKWEEFPPKIIGEYLMLWPGQFATKAQKDRGVTVPSSMRQVDGSAELGITQGYAGMATTSGS
jgi:hypothetical protein